MNQFTNLISVLRKRPQAIALIVLGLVALAAYFHTTQMYFWQDDSAIIFKAQHIEEDMGSFGPGLLGTGAYRYLPIPFYFLYQVFGKNPTPYFVGAVLFYIVATLIFYKTASIILRSQRLGFLTALLFASGFLGSATFYRVINSYQTVMSFILASVTLAAFAKYLYERRLRWYFLSLFMFAATIEIVFIRSHGVIFGILALDFFYTAINYSLTYHQGASRVPPRTTSAGTLRLTDEYPKTSVAVPRIERRSLEKILEKLQSEAAAFGRGVYRLAPILLVRQLPFLLLYYHWYFTDGFGENSILKFLQEVLLQRKVEYLIPYFGLLGNALLPDAFVKSIQTGFNINTVNFHWLALVLFTLIFVALWRVFKFHWLMLPIASFLALIWVKFNLSMAQSDLYWHKDLWMSLMASLGGLLLLTSVLTFIGGVKEKTLISVLLVFSLVWVGAAFLAYFIQYRTFIWDTTHRYLHNAIIGYSIFWVSFFYLIFAKLKKLKVLVLAVVLLVSINLYYSQKIQAALVKERSIPTRDFYQSLLSQVPSIEKGAIFLFEVQAENKYRNQFRDFFSVGSMPNQTALAMHYDVDRYDLVMVESASEMLYWLQKGVENNWPPSLENVYTFFYGEEGLTDTSAETRRILQEGRVENIKLESELNLPLTTPVILEFDLKLTPQLITEFPYQSKDTAKEEVAHLSDLSLADKEVYFDYLMTRQEYYQSVQVSSESEWRYNEAKYLTDQRLDTSWRGHRIYWHDHERDSITIDLGETKRIGRLVWVNGNSRSSITHYEIAVSTNGDDWQVVKKVENGGQLQDEQIMVDDFDAIDTRLVRMQILGTLDNDSPWINEIEGVEEKYKSVDLPKANLLQQNPGAYINSTAEYQLIQKYLRQTAQLRLSWATKINPDFNQENSLGFAVSVDGKSHHYRLIIPAGGTQLRKLKINNLPIPLEVEAKNIQLVYPNWDQIQKANLVPEFSEN